MNKDVDVAVRTMGSLWPRVVVPLVLCLVALDAIAQTDEGRSTFNLQSSMKAAQGDAAPRTQFELNASTLPRFETTDTATKSQHLDLSLLPPGRSALGPSLGLTSAETSPNFNPAALPPASPSVDLGVHWRYRTDGNSRVDVRAWRRVSQQPDATAALAQVNDASYGARVEMQVQAERKGFVTDHGFVGFQLESGARITVRRSGGKPMLYYRAGF